MVDIDYIEETTALFIPEAAPKRTECAFKQLFPLGRILACNPKRVEPERLNLYRLSHSRCDDMIAHLGIHPGQLQSFHSRAQKPIGVCANTETSSARIALDYRLRCFQQSLSLRTVGAAGAQIFVNTDDKPKGCVD